jgi:hypothetical protein
VQSNMPQNNCDLVLSPLSSTPSMAGHLEQFVDHEDPLNSVFHVSDSEGWDRCETWLDTACNKASFKDEESAEDFWWVMCDSYLSGVDAPDVMPMVTLPFFRNPGVTYRQGKKESV